jgi:hypothetical protein
MVKEAPEAAHHKRTSSGRGGRSGRGGLVLIMVLVDDKA